MFSSSQIKRNRAFRWNDRIRVAHEICSGLSFLHLARPAQVHLTASNVLLDRNLVAKISETGLVEEAVATGQTTLLRVLDERAGKWPLDLASRSQS
ncbi:hypothetical protein OIU77_003585 [Salix suchowensis]|uniref:RING-type E3 ubiquitin transferase n=1 Tax=Salix suchowensis TaxID=1278906 RepID=A0ABQ9B076_9ROSI|nr:hypothetical protein OIU77_003585 [Salix suchowensis]